MSQIGTISKERLAYMDQHYSKQIECPWRDDSQCTGKATLYLKGHAYQGVIECDACGSDSCEHEDTHTESVEVTYWPTPDIDASYNTDIEVCDLCECEVDA